MTGRFTALLQRFPGEGGWHYVVVPPALQPTETGAWGRTAVRVAVDGRVWETSVWADRRHGCILPIAARARGDKDVGDAVEIELLGLR